MPLAVLEDVQVVRIAVACELHERPMVVNMLWGTSPRQVLGSPCARGYWPNAKIVAVEPHPQSFELMTKNTSHIPESQLLRINAAISSKPGKCLLSFPVSNSRVADYVPDVWDSLEPRYRDFGIEVPSLTVEQFWTQVTDFGIDEVDLIKLDCEGAEYLIISELSALGLMDRIGWIRGEWHSRKDNILLANLLSQTHVFNIDPNYPHSVGMFVAHRNIC